MDAEKALLVRHIIELAKAELVNRNLLVQAAMRAEYMSAIYSPHTPSAISQITLDRKLSAVGKSASNTERQIASRVSSEIFDIIGESETPDMMSNLLNYQGEIIKQLGRDANTISTIFQKTQLGLSNTNSGSLVIARANALRAVGGQKVFTYKDKVKKLWDAGTYLNAHSSQYYYGLANDLVIAGMRAKGDVNAILNRPGHVSDGMVMSLENLDKEKYFHPGSQGKLT